MKNFISAKKEVWVLLLLLIVTSLYFWSASRYPALNEKSSKAGQENLSEILTERPVFILEENAPLLEKIFLSSINWLSANLNGMVFGVFIAALILSLLNYLKIPNFKSPFLNTFLGSILGTPLGLCVNCAAPVAKGFYKGGLKSGLALAVMFSSPKFNVVIMAMAFSLFPFYIVLIKYIATGVFIFVILPILVSFFIKDTNNESLNQNKPPSLSTKDKSITWRVAITNSLYTLLMNLWYVIKKVVPLMFLAGLLGATAAHLFSFEGIIMDEVSLFGLIIVSAVALFLPMPIGVDLLLAEMLFQSGGQIAYVTVLLFSLGIYSIYSLFIVWKFFSKSLAIGIFIVLLMFSTATGMIANHYTHKQEVVSIEYYKEALSYIEKNRKIEKSNTANKDTIKELPMANPITFDSVYIDNNIKISGFKLIDRENNLNTLYSKNSGNAFGLIERFINYDELYEPFFYGRSVASGDINNDGWEDMVFAQKNGIDVYLNTGGKFSTYSLEGDIINESSIHVLALVDINNDNWNDLFLSTYNQGNYFIMNEKGILNTKSLIKAPDNKPSITMSVSFADINGNGHLDFCLGNWGFGYYTRAEAPPIFTQNLLVYNHNLTFTKNNFEKSSGETLSVLFTDLNNDGETDLMIGNDFSSPDKYYLGTKNGFRLIGTLDSLFELSPYYTMSVRTADINNDLLLDSYVTGLNFEGPEETESEKSYSKGKKYEDHEYEDYCSNYSNPNQNAKCTEMISARDILPKAEPKLVNIRNCEVLKDDLQAYRECLALGISFEALKQKNQSLCDIIDPEFGTLRSFCQNYFSYINKETESALKWKQLKPDSTEILQVKGQNALHMGAPSSKLINATNQSILKNTGWTWNTAFADLDNDEYQDVFTVNGCYEHQKIYNMNYFFKNIKGKGFERIQIESGLDDVGITHSFIYIDIDLDGDLDIVTRSAVGQIYVYKNNECQNNLISIQLLDQIGNTNAIGAKVYIEYGNGESQMREFTLGGGFMSYQVPIAHFGLGKNKKIHKITIRWADGTESIINTTLYANHKYLIERYADKKNSTNVL